MVVMAVVTFLGHGDADADCEALRLRSSGPEETQFGLAVAPIAAGMGIFAVPLGHLGDRFGKTTAVCWGLFVSSIAMWMLALFRSLYLAAGAGVLIGLGFTIAFPAWNALVISSTDPGRRGEVLGAVGLAQGLAAMAGTLIGPHHLQIRCAQLSQARHSQLQRAVLDQRDPAVGRDRDRIHVGLQQESRGRAGRAHYCQAEASGAWWRGDWGLWSCAYGSVGATRCRSRPTASHGNGCSSWRAGSDRQSDGLHRRDAPGWNGRREAREWSRTFHDWVYLREASYVVHGPQISGSRLCECRGAIQLCQR